jgi:atypical dual specificity phosphatase
MQKELGITAVLNLQVTKDIERHCLGIIGPDAVKCDRDEYSLDAVNAMRKAYEENNILFIWIPITDFSSNGRELMSPQAAIVLKTMLDKGHRIYVHCNAGTSKRSLKSLQG